uniref:Uncharacterized protein n=1 Tax=Balaenoptera musculus TaxID=9771 RepID=A0A8C0CR31_BALMU
MPAPEQASLVEERQPQTHQEAASTGPGMESETTATTILASMKEQITLHVEESWKPIMIFAV